MHYAPQALLSCVALLSLLTHGNAARGLAPTEVLTNFARTIGIVLEPILTDELQEKSKTSKTIKPRQVSAQDAPGGSAAGVPAAQNPAQGINPNPVIPFQNQAIPFQFDRAYNQFRYPAYAQQQQQQIAPNFYPGVQNGFGAAGLLPIHPRFFQQPFAANQQQQLGPAGLPIVPKGLAVNVNPNNVNNNNNNVNGNGKIKENIKNAADSKSSAQNPLDSADFSPFNQLRNGANIGNGGVGGGNPNANLQIDGRFSALDYERIRQNYFGNGNPVNNYYSSLNEIPFSSGPPYRSQLSGNFNYNSGLGGGVGVGGGDGAQGAAGQVGASPGDIGTNGAVGAGQFGNPYFNSPFLQGPGFYQGLGGGQFNGFDQTSGNRFRTPFGAGPQQFNQNGFYFPGSNGNAGPGGGLGGGPGFNDQDSSLRATSAKETVSPETETLDASTEGREGSSLEEQGSTEGAQDRAEKVRFNDEEEKGAGDHRQQQQEQEQQQQEEDGTEESREA